MSKHFDVSTFLSSINYVSFYQKHIPGFQPNGKDEVLCRCPFPGHEDTHKSFSVNVKTGLWHCFAGCGAGNPIQIVQKLYDLAFRSAIERIASEEGIDNPFQRQNGNQNKQGRTSYLTLNQITAIHHELISNEAILKEFQSKYGLTLETIKKYLIGYKQGKYVIPIEIAPKKWHYKLHKGYQSRGAKAGIYPADIIKDDLPYIIITEGEFKAMLLNQFGFPAVTTTAGAGTWKPEWNDLFRGFNVYLAYDNDEAGRKGEKKVANSLKGIAKSVKRIQWPPFMNGKDKKDVTDFFVVLGKTKQDFQALINSATEIGYNIKELDGLKFVEPEDYLVDEQGIKHLSMFKDNTIEKLISPAPVVITARAVDIDLGNEEIEIAFLRDWKWKKLWVSRRTLCDFRKVIELSDQGVPVSSSNARQMVDYFCASETTNIPVIKRTYVTRGLGWKTVDDKKVFLIHNDNSNAVIDLIPEIGFERYVKALRQEGSYEIWKNAIEEAIEKYPVANFAFYASFAAPLLNILKAPNFIIDFWGLTSLGKTTVMEMAASVWGYPPKETGGLVFSWYSSKVHFERIANFFCDIPIFPDDSHLVDEKTITPILYMIANGVGRGRGAVTGIRHTPSWHTVCFSTGERSISECTTFAGAKARTISFHGTPFENNIPEFINSLTRIVRENFGYAGPKFIEALTTLIKDPDETEKLKTKYRKYQSDLSLIAKTEVGDRYSHYFAVVLLAAGLVNDILGINNPKAKSKIMDVFVNFINESNNNEIDMPTRAMRYVLSWASGNERYFKSMDYESYGVWVEGEHIAIYPHKLSEVLKKEGFSEKSVLKEWDNRHWIKKQDRHTTYALRINISTESKIRRFILIPWAVVDKFLYD